MKSLFSPFQPWSTRELANMLSFVRHIEMFAGLLIPVIIDWPVKKFYIRIIEAMFIAIGLYFFPKLFS